MRAVGARLPFWWYLLPVVPYGAIYLASDAGALWLPDDAYHYLQVARNLAAGLGSTFDGLHPTNGYHPLWLWLLTPIAALVDGGRALVDTALSLQLLLVALSLWLLTGEARGERATRALPWLVCLALLANVYFQKIFVNGLESALLLLLATLLLRRAPELPEASPARAAAIGLLAALATLARLDAGLLLVAVFLFVAPREPWWRAPAAGARVLAFLAPTAVLLTGYALANRALFGIPLPVSAYLKGGPPSGGPQLAFLVGTLALVLAVALAHLFLSRALHSAGRHRQADILAIVSIWLALTLLYHHLYLRLVIPPLWYLVPHAVWAILAAVALVESSSAGRRRLATAAVLALAALAAIASWAYRLSPPSDEHYRVRREIAAWIDDHLPPEAILAGWDVGMIGYFSGRSVVNLDGLVNSAEYLRVLEAGEAVAFLDAAGVDFIVQYYPSGHERAAPEGFADAREFRRRTREIVLSRAVRSTRPTDRLAVPRRPTRVYAYEIREWRRDSGGL